MNIYHSQRYVSPRPGATPKLPSQRPSETNSGIQWLCLCQPCWFFYTARISSLLSTSVATSFCWWGMEYESGFSSPPLLLPLHLEQNTDFLNPQTCTLSSWEPCSLLQHIPVKPASRVLTYPKVPSCMVLFLPVVLSTWRAHPSISSGLLLLLQVFVPVLPPSRLLWPNHLCEFPTPLLITLIFFMEPPSFPSHCWPQAVMGSELTCSLVGFIFCGH